MPACGFGGREWGASRGRGGVAMSAVSTSRSRVLVSIRGSVAVAYCIGTLDRLAVEELSQRVRALVFDGVWGFVCSLERVNHIHFQALQGLIALHQMVREAGGRMLLSDASPYLRQILEFGGVPARVSVLPEKNLAVDELLENHGLGCSAAAPLPGVQQTFF